MKKILVPIDYSSHSDNAVSYAIEIAKKINATIHIFHAVQPPEVISMPGFISWPADLSKMKGEADKDLALYVSKIPENKSLSLPYLPGIESSTSIGVVEEEIEKTIEVEKPDLVVMGMEGKGTIDRFLLGSTSREMIENPQVPILLVPAKATYRPFEKIAFATDLSDSDLNTIHSLARLFCLYNPDILLVHVDNKPSDFHDPRTLPNQFLNRVTCNINYGKIYYRHIQESDINKGLEWLSENARVDMLSMIHRHSDRLSRLIRGSHTQKLARSIQLPLLVMPEDKQPIGW